MKIAISSCVGNPHSVEIQKDIDANEVMNDIMILNVLKRLFWQFWPFVKF